MTDLRDTVILVAGGKSGYAILFGIHTHGAEFQDFKLLAVFGQANLLVKSRTTIGFDCNSRNQKHRTQDNQCCQ